MKPFFLKNIDATETIKVADTNFFDCVSGIDANTDWARLLPFVQKTIDFDVIPFLGNAAFETITLLPETSLGLRYLRNCIAEYAMSRAIPTLRLTLGNGGVAENTPQHSAPAPQWATRGAEATARKSGDGYLDLLLAWCEKESPEYKTSEAYKEKVSLLFKNTADLNVYLNILNSRRTFESLVKHLKKAETSLIALVCGNWIVTTENDTLLHLAKTYVSNLALAQAVPFLRMLVEADGFKAVSSTDGFEDKKSLTNSNQSESIVALRNAAQQEAETAIRDITLFLKANAVDFPIWSNSPCGQKIVIKKTLVIGKETGAVMLT